MKYIQGFEKKTRNYVRVTKVKLQCGENCNVYTITDKYDLIQFIGYGKYLNKETDNVYYRGQPDYYRWKMIPSLLRSNPVKSFLRIIISWLPHILHTILAARRSLIRDTTSLEWGQ